MEQEWVGKGKMVEFIQKISDNPSLLNDAIRKGFDLHKTYKVFNIFNVVISETKPFMIAARFGNLKLINSFLNRGFDINMKDDAGVLIIIMKLSFLMQQKIFQ